MPVHADRHVVCPDRVVAVGEVGEEVQQVVDGALGVEDQEAV